MQCIYRGVLDKSTDCDSLARRTFAANQHGRTSNRRSPNAQMSGDLAELCHRIAESVFVLRHCSGGSAWNWVKWARLLTDGGLLYCKLSNFYFRCLPACVCLESDANANSFTSHWPFLNMRRKCCGQYVAKRLRDQHAVCATFVCVGSSIPRGGGEVQTLRLPPCSTGDPYDVPAVLVVPNCPERSLSAIWHLLAGRLGYFTPHSSSIKGL